MAEAFIGRYFTPAVSYWDACGSYGLKHRVEKWAGGYVSNGAFIQAALNLGYSIKRLDRGPNCFIKFKPKNRSERGMILWGNFPKED